MRAVGSRTALATVALGIAVLTGAAIGLLASRTPVPGQLEAAVADESAETISVEFADARRVPLDVAFASEIGVSAPTGGVVTGAMCRPGDSVRSGSAPFAINGEPVVALATRLPLWRALSAGDSGDDVRALQETLSVHGASVVVDGVVGFDTVAAFREVYARSVGFAPRASGIPFESLAWLPLDGGVVAACPIGVGSAVGAGQTMLALLPTATSVEVARLPSDAVPGGRVLVVDGVRVAVDPNGRATDPAALAALASTAVFEEVRRDPDGVIATGSWELADPIAATGVPPAAILAVIGDQACVVSEDRVIRAIVLGSQLGYTLLEFTGNPPSSVDLTPDRRLTCG